jgi:anti-sigma factor RsiW
MRCRTAQAAIVAAGDGELGARHRRALDRHLAHCDACRAERVSVEGVRGALATLAPEAAVPARLEQEVLRRVRVLASEGAERAPGYRLAQWLAGIAPGLAATAVVVVAVLGVRANRNADVVGTTSVAVTHTPAPARPARVAAARHVKSRVPDEPPAELASRPDLFVDLPILRDLDKLQHFDSIATMEEDDPSTPANDPSPSNG